MKYCPGCDTEKSLSEWGTNKARYDGYNSYCKKCVNQRTRIWQTKNKERVAKNALTCYYRHHEEYKRRGKFWRLQNPEKTRAMYVKYHQENPDKNREYQHERRARKRNAFIEKVERQVVFERDQGTCYLCQVLVDPNNWHLEHIIPLSKGGLHCYANVAVSCPPCNLNKRDKLPEDLGSGGSYFKVQKEVMPYDSLYFM